jgi:hypothetical protein
MNRVSRTVFLAALLAGPNLSANAGTATPPSYDVADNFLSYIVPTTPLAAKRFQVSVIPAYFEHRETYSPGGLTLGNQTGSDSAKGDGLGFSALYAFSDHIGATVMGIYFKGTGTNSAEVGGLSSPYPILADGGSFSMHGEVGTAALLLDPFDDPKGFRLPFVLGMSYVGLHENTSLASSLGTGTNSLDTTFLAATAGLAAQIPAGEWLKTARWFRLTPFVLGSVPVGSSSGGPKTIQCGPSGTQCAGPFTNNNWSRDLETTGLVVGLPWDMAFTYVPPFGSIGSTHTAIYSLSLHKSFGRAKPETGSN